MKTSPFAALPAALLGATALATTLLQLDPPALCKGSDLVVRGTVESAASRWTGDHRRIITEVRIEVAESFKGAAPKSVLVEQPGGVVGSIGQRVEGIARFDPGEEVVVFLEKRPGDRYLVTGMAQGKFRVERSSDGKSAFAIPGDLSGAALVDPASHQPVAAHSQAIKLDELRALVRAQTALERPNAPGTK